MTLFSQFDFSTGLEAEVDSVKTPKTGYSLLVNGRSNKNVISPVKKHKKINAPTGKKQGFYAVGANLYLFAGGDCYYADATGDITWRRISGWSQLNTTNRIYAEPVPLGYEQFTTKVDASDIKQSSLVFNGSIARTPAGLFVTDGTSQPVILYADGTYEVTGEYPNWTQNAPKYVPKGVLPRKSGSKLYIVDPIDRNKIYQSVSGRCLDFVINRDENGDKGGDAETTYKSVDYNAITGMVELDNGGLFIGTLYGSYTLMPDYTNTIFGEPMLLDGPVFPTGPVNERSFADILGDTAFITQSGVVSFNYTANVKRESNSFPLSRPIKDLLVQPQTNTAAINFDNYALFSLDSIYGKVVFVYDITKGHWVGIDNEFGEVVDFAVVKYEGARRLFFTNSADEVYEAYASDEYATCRVYLGDYSTMDAGKKHIVTGLRLEFNNITQDTTLQVGYYANRQRTIFVERDITSQYPVDASPVPLPFIDYSASYPVDIAIDDRREVWRSGVWAEWQGYAELTAVSVEGTLVEKDSYRGLTVKDDTDKTRIVFFGDNAWNDEKSGSNMERVAVNKGEYYYIYGSANVGGRIANDEKLVLKGDYIYLDGNAIGINSLQAMFDKMKVESPDWYVVLGNLCPGYALDNHVAAVMSVLDRTKLSYVLGWYEEHYTHSARILSAINSQAYYKKTIGDIDLFIISTWEDFNPDTKQLPWLKYQTAHSTARFKIVCMNPSPYSEDDAGEFSAGPRWDFDGMGVDVVIAGGNRLYQRFNKEIPYIANGPIAGEIWELNNPIQDVAPDMYYRGHGYLLCEADRFNLTFKYKTLDGTIRDIFTIHR